MTTKIKVKPEGRKGVYLPDAESLKAYIQEKDLPQIHCFFPGAIMIGADWSREAVLKEIDVAVRMAICLEESGAHHMGHMLSLIVEKDKGSKDERELLQIYDIGKLTVEDLEISND